MKMFVPPSMHIKISYPSFHKVCFYFLNRGKAHAKHDAEMESMNEIVITLLQEEFDLETLYIQLFDRVNAPHEMCLMAGEELRSLALRASIQEEEQLELSGSPKAKNLLAKRKLLRALTVETRDLQQQLDALEKYT